MNSPFARFDLPTAPLAAGTVLLEASAGTGKTYTLVGILLRLLLERAVDRLDQILVVTFTIAATEELKTRLREGLDRVLRGVEVADPDPFFAALAQRDGARDIVRRALDDFDRAPIATIHGFCKRLLDEAAFESREPFELDFLVDAAPLVHRAAADALRALYAPEPTPQHAVVTIAKLDPDRLAQLHRLWRRYPDVVLEPAVADPAPHLAALALAVAHAATTLDDTVAARIASFLWRSGESPFGDDIQADLAALRHTLATEPLLAVGPLLELTPAVLAESLIQRSRQPDDHPFFAAADAVAMAFRAASDHLRSGLLQAMDRRLEADKAREHVLSFDDLLRRTHAALQDPARCRALLPALRDRYHCALIDEFQDTDALQYEIFARCFRERPLFLIGDPKQSIYGFRGADLRSYLAAAGDAAVQATLDTNYRSHGDLVRAIGQLFDGPRAFVEPRITMPQVHAFPGAEKLVLGNDPGAALRFRFVPGNDGKAVAKAHAEPRIAADVAAEITRLCAGTVRLDGGPVLPRHCAVLTRTNLQAVLVQDALREAGVPSAIGKAGDVFETDEMDEVELLMRAVLQPRNAAAVRAALATRFWGFAAAAIAGTHEDSREFDDQLERIDSWRRLWHRHGFVVMAERAFHELGVAERLLQQRGGERALTNLQQIVELLHGAEHAQRLSPEGLHEWLQHERRHKDELDYQLRELRLESDEDAVQILTVHGSKGLQYEIVFCPFLWDGHKMSDGGIAPLPTGRRLTVEFGEREKRAADVERLAEDVRLAYVGMTRAKRRCYVHVGNLGSNISGMFRSSLAWLLWPIDADLVADPDALMTWQKAARAGVARLPARLAELAAASAGAIGVDAVPAEPTAVPIPAPTQTTLDPVLEPRRRVPARAVHSFTSLVSGAPDTHTAPDVADPPVATDADATPVAAEGIFAFARGARAGQCLHEVLEHTDLADLDSGAAAAIVQKRLAAFGLADPKAHDGPIAPVDCVLQNLRDLARARASTGGPTLAALCSGPRAAEWKFTLPLPQGELGTLATLFARHGSPLAQRYADRLRHLPPRTLRGYLTGFVDLLACHDGRYWVLDWKSNHLGNRGTDYDDERLAAAMIASDYVLQYHLYVLALHRQLRARLRDYDVERHHGGICYVFLRGAEPDGTRGMLHDRVPAALVDAMDRWAGGTR